MRLSEQQARWFLFCKHGLVRKETKRRWCCLHQDWVHPDGDMRCDERCFSSIKDGRPNYCREGGECGS